MSSAFRIRTLAFVGAMLAATELAAAPESAAIGKPRILCLGDSLTEGLGVKPEEAWPALLETALKANGMKDAVVVNAGISGSTSASGPSRIRWLLKGPTKPDVIILELGANDGLRGASTETMKKNLEETIELSRESGAQMLLAGMKMPTNYGADYTKKFEAVFPELALAQKVPLIPFILDGVAADPKLNQADGIHPTAAGHKIVAKTVLGFLTPLLAEPKKK